MSLKKKKIVIIGGAGFIGHNLSLALKKKKFQVSVIDSLSVNNLYSIKKKKSLEYPYSNLTKLIIKERLKLLKENNIELLKLDVRNLNKLSLCLKKLKPQIVIHLAAVSHANRSNINPKETFENSLVTLNNVLECIKTNVKHFIFFSSSMVYGDFKGKKVRENNVCSPKGIYGGLKLAAEQIIKAYSQVFNLPYTIVRPSALYGERCISRRVGQIFIENALHKNQIKIQGDGREKLDFTYIEDLINGIVSIIKSKKSINQTFNLTFGNSKSINSMLSLLKKEFPDVKVDYISRDKLMPVRGTLCINKAKKLLGYKPRCDLNKGYVKYIKWYKNFLKERNYNQNIVIK